MSITPPIKIPRYGDTVPLVTDEKLKVLEPIAYGNAIEELNTVEQVLEKIQELRDAQREIEKLERSVFSLTMSMRKVADEIIKELGREEDDASVLIPAAYLRGWAVFLRNGGAK